MNFSDIYFKLRCIIFTRRCRYCKTVVDVRKDVCPQCENEIFKIYGDICFRCGCSLKECTCKKKASLYARVCAPYYYKGAAKRAVTRLKFYNDPYMAETLAQDMAECFKTHYGEMDFDICTFVPSHKAEIKNRGYNQAQLLAEKLSEILGIPCKPLLYKTIPTKPQHTLDETMRAGNLLGSIVINPEFETKLQDTRILLCDDVKTTGATLNECTKTLLINGAAEVDCIAVCVAHKEKKEL
ncbi:MAG: ComF family protein [Clostridia bacterium]|nr:ComF family protein [Clostridia bacterium]